MNSIFSNKKKKNNLSKKQKKANNLKQKKETKLLKMAHLQGSGKPMSTKKMVSGHLRTWKPRIMTVLQQIMIGGIHSRVQI
jgi:hypothetical protein